jgi:hypothetical protein
MLTTRDQLIDWMLTHLIITEKFKLKAKQKV